MPFRVNCPGCKALYELADAHRGKPLRCQKCGQVFRLPGTPPATAPVPAPAREERLQPRPVHRVPAAVAASSPAPAPLPAKRGGVSCLLATVACLFALCAGVGIGAGGVAAVILARQPASVRDPAPGAVAAAPEDPVPAAATAPAPAAPPPKAAEEPAPAPPVAAAPERRPSQRPERPRPAFPRRGNALPEGVFPDRETLPVKAVIGRPFTYDLPNPGGSVKYELLGHLKQKYKGLNLTPDGQLSWTPPVGTPAGPLQLMLTISAGGPTRLLTYLLPLEEDPATTVPLPPPGGWVMLPDNVTLIAALPTQAQLVYIDTLGCKETKRVDLDFKPSFLAFQGDNLFAATEGGAAVHVLDLKTGKAKKEVRVSNAPLAALACHPEKGLVYASNNQRRIVAFDPDSGKVTDTGREGVFLAVDPAGGDAVFAGIQGQIRDTIEFRDLGGGRVSIRSGTTGDRALLIRYAVKGGGLVPAGANPNAAVNGRVLRVSPDGKKVCIAGGGGNRPPAGGAIGGGGKGYGVALFSTGDVNAMLGEAECGSYPENLAFHPVLDLGVVEQASLGGRFHLFDTKSFVERGIIELASGEGPAKERKAQLLTFGGKGTRLVYHDVRGSGSYLRLIPLPLTDKDKAALEAAYGK
jgi:hypothetical protein